MPRDPVQIQSLRRTVEVSGPDHEGDIMLDIETDDGWLSVYLNKTATQQLLHELNIRSEEQ